MVGECTCSSQRKNTVCKMDPALQIMLLLTCSKSFKIYPDHSTNQEHPEQWFCRKPLFLYKIVVSNTWVDQICRHISQVMTRQLNRSRSSWKARQHLLSAPSKPFFRPPACPGESRTKTALARRPAGPQSPQRCMVAGIRMPCSFTNHKESFIGEHSR